MVIDREDYYYWLLRNDLNLGRVRVFLSNGLDPNSHNIFGDTLLHMAATSQEANTGIIRELINAGADVNSPNINRYTPLHDAVCYRKAQMVEILLESGADIAARTIQGCTALHLAIDNTIEKFSRFVSPYLDIFHADINIVKMLLNHEGIDLDAQSNDGKTPLHTAVDSLETSSAKVLLARGSNPNIVGPHQSTPLHCLLFNAYFTELYDDSKVIADLLLQYGADLCSLDRFNKTPIDLIVEAVTDEESLSFSKYFVRKLISYRNLSEDVISNIERNAELGSFRRICSAEKNRMMTHVICRQLTVHDFMLDCFNYNQFYNQHPDPHVSFYKTLVDILLRVLDLMLAVFYGNREPPGIALYTPLVDILLTRVYSVYFNDIFKVTSRQRLWDVYTYNVSLINEREEFKNLDHLLHLQMCINSERVMPKCLTRGEIFLSILAASDLAEDQINALRLLIS